MKEQKKCNECNVLKIITDFRHQKKKSKKKGEYIYISKKCKKCELYKNKKSHNKATKKYYSQNKEYYKKYREDNEQKLKIYREKYKDRANFLRRERRQTDPEYKIMCNLRCRVRKTLKKSKSKNTITLLGCTISFFKKWIEWQFNSKMSWNNYGIYWEIDHVIPCSSFSLENIEEQNKCFNWSNCRPLESLKNSSKNNKILPFTIMLQELRIIYYIKYATCLEAGTSLEPLLPPLFGN